MYMYTAQYSTRRADGWLVVSGAGEMRNVSEVYAGMKRAPNIVTIGLLPWGALSDPEARRLVRPAPGPRPPRPPPARTALPSLYSTLLYSYSTSVLHACLPGAAPTWMMRVQCIRDEFGYRRWDNCSILASALEPASAPGCTMWPLSIRSSCLLDSLT